MISDIYQLIMCVPAALNNTREPYEEVSAMRSASHICHTFCLNLVRIPWLVFQAGNLKAVNLVALATSIAICKDLDLKIGLNMTVV